MSQTNQLDALAEEILPAALGDLASRHETARELVQYLEDRYMQSKHHGQDSKSVEIEAHAILAETLQEVASDVDRITGALDHMLRLESSVITTLAQRVSMTASRMRLNEDRYARQKLKKVRVSRITQLSQTQEASSAIDGSAASDEKGFAAGALPSHERLALNKRLQSLRHLVYPELRIA